MTSLWLAEAAPCRIDTPAPAAVDVAIVGGGIAGISTALHLTRRGVRVLVLERGTIASRASGRNDGQLLLGLGEHYHRIHGQFGAERARLLWDFLRDNHDDLRRAVKDARIECDLTQQGGLRLAETPHEWHELVTAAALLAAEQKPHALVPADRVADHLPEAVGFHGGLFLDGEAIVQPVRMVRGLAELAMREGAHLCEHAAVAGIDGEAGAFRLRLADGRSFAASLVVHCTSTLALALDRSNLLGRTVFPFRGQVLASAPLPTALQARFPAYAMSSNFCYEYFRLSQGRFVIGGMRWSVPGEEVGLLDDSQHNPQITENLLGYARSHFPCLAGIEFPHVWTGIMAGTPDGLPLVGALPGAPGTFALCAFNGYGLSFAFLAGRCLADLIVDGRCAHPAIGLFSPRRFHAH